MKKFTLMTLALTLFSCATKKVETHYPDSMNALTGESLKNSLIGKTSDVLVAEFKSCLNKTPDSFYQKAKDLLDKEQNNFSYWNIIGNCYLENDDTDKALFFYKLSLSKAKNKYHKAIFYNNLGSYYILKNRSAKAISSFEKSLKLVNRLRSPKLNLAHLYVRKGLEKRALDYLKSLNRRDPDVIALKAVLDLQKNDKKSAKRKISSIDKKYLGSSETMTVLELVKDK